MTALLDQLAFVALVITTTGLPLGVWARDHNPRRHGDRQLLALIHHHTRKAQR